MVRSTGCRDLRSEYTAAADGDAPWCSLVAALVLLTLILMPTTSVDAAANLPDELKQQIVANKDDVNKIIEFVLRGAGKHETFNQLAALGDKFGPRLTGSPGLDQALDYSLAKLQKENFSNVHAEDVDVPKWVRGHEFAQLVEPRNETLHILGLGSSVGTNGSTLEADVIVVKSFDDLVAKKNNVSGKIVVYNQGWQGSYGAGGPYRGNGATEAARHGAVAAMVESLTPFSIDSPHTGIQFYGADVPQIPAVSITVEDAEMLYRMQSRGERIRIQLYMEARNEGTVISRNVVGELTGKDFPNTTVIFGGHIDSWDVGTGSMDDGSGVMIAWQAMSVLSRLNLKPRRTLRLVLWTAEEQGTVGSDKYYEVHITDELNTTTLVMQADGGTFKPKGIGFTGCGLALAMMEEIMQLLAELNTTAVLKDAGRSSDTGRWVTDGVPGVEMYSENEKYFWYHHSEGDTMTVLNADDLDITTIIWATVAYVTANLDDLLPRTGDYPSAPVSGSTSSMIGQFKSDLQSTVLLLAGTVTVIVSRIQWRL